MIFVVDFGSQTAHLIARRIRESGIETEMVSPENAYGKATKEKPKGLIFSGGPASVYEKGAPTIDKKIFSLGIPILGICYGLQLTAHLLGGKVVAGRKEYGPATLKMKNERSKMKNKNFSSLIFHLSSKLPQQFIVWMSHGDEVVKLPERFEIIGSTEHVPFAFVENHNLKIIGLQFHPEVEHTEFGKQIIKNFVEICSLSSVILGTQSEAWRTPESPTAMRDSGQARMTNVNKSVDTDKLIADIKTVVADAYVIGAVSGGVDSTVAAYLTAKAIGKKLIPVYVDNGLMRVGTTGHVKNIFSKLNTSVKIINVQKEMLKKLKGVTDSEKKRKIIGRLYIEVFEKEMDKLIKQGKDVKFLLQGTIYSDVIESGAPRSPADASAKEDQGITHASKIKSHHNVGGLPKGMKLKLLEPLRTFYKDEIREIGRQLGLPEEFVEKQVFPGPGYGIRIRGEVTSKRLKQEKMADEIILEELEKNGLLDKVYMSFPVMSGTLSTAVKGDGRAFDEVIALRIIESKDVMTSTWARLPYDVLQKISSRIVNEVPNVSRVVYDITTKPPATMEWE